MSGLVKEPFTSVITKVKNVTSGTTMITRAPWPNGQYYRIRKMECASMDPVTTSGLLWKFWDQDLSSTTTAAVGSANNALILVGPQLGIAVSGGVALTVSGQSVTTVSKFMDQQPRIPFYAGVTVLTNQNSSITLELEVV
jgi:hypothetical protein